jgi:GNAT superfamily N-acetyltransferase
MYQRATKEDATALLLLSQALAGETGEPFSVDAARQLIERFVTDPNCAAFVDKHNETINGVFFGLVAPQPWAPENLYATDMGCWVLPWCRGGGVGRGLMMQYVEWARTLGARKIMVSFRPEFVEASHKDLTELGFQVGDTTYFIKG